MSLSCSTLVRFGFVSDVSVHFFYTIPKDALLSVRCRTYIYRSPSGSSVLALLRTVHVPLGNGPFQALDRGPSLFSCESLDILRVSIGLFLFRAICYFTCHLGTLLIFFPVISRYIC